MATGSAGIYCPFCGSDQFEEFEAGYSEYSHQCVKCSAGFAIDREAGTVKTRRWDRQAARGIHDEFSLSQLTSPPEAGQVGQNP